MMQEGEKAPDFSLKDSSGKVHKLSDYLGKKVILYFYPKDDTPGCTQEACDFRDSIPLVTKKKAVVLGVSADSEKSHEKFAKKFGLPFTLLSDPDKKLLQAYGVWGGEEYVCRKYMGITRSTFVIDEKGRVLKVFSPVKVPGHVQEVLALL
ncbi:thioredoxin-dependent thiol peroxidase [Candidatus Woesearchaeota archaeon]|nr:thioredoxin-dependent thiol peroxidase [Candidatus Woesearchaeota archaeon]